VMLCHDRYANEKDDDLRGMESSYSQQLKEDAIRYQSVLCILLHVQM